MPATAIPRLTRSRSSAGRPSREGLANVGGELLQLAPARAGRNGCGARSCARRRPAARRESRPYGRCRRRTRSSRRRRRSRRSARWPGRLRCPRRRLPGPAGRTSRRGTSAAPLRRRSARARRARSSSRTRAANCSPLSASRTAEVSTARFASQSCSSISGGTRASALEHALDRGVGERARGVDAFAEARHLRAPRELLAASPLSRSTSAISRRVEFVPMSTTATRTRADARGFGRALSEAVAALARRRDLC